MTLTCFSKAIAKNALIILVNLSSDGEVLKNLAEDDVFLQSLLLRITVCQFPNNSSFSRDYSSMLIIAIERQGTSRK